MQASMLRVTRGRLAAISPGSLLSRTRPSVCPLITQSVSPPSARSRLLPGTFSSGSGFRGYRGLAASAHDSAAQVEAPGPPLWRRVLGWLLGWILRLALAAVAFVAAAAVVTPPILRTERGLNAVCYVASAVTPGTSTVKCDRADMGWRSPLDVRNLRIVAEDPLVGDVDVLRVGSITSRSSLADFALGSRTNTVLVQDMVVDMSPVSTIDPTPRFLAYTNTQPLPPAPPSAQGTYSHTFTTSPKSTMPQAGGQQLPAPPAATASQPPAHMQKPEYQSKKASPNTTPKKKASERQTAKPYLDNRLVPLSAELLSAQAEVYVTDSHALVAEAASEPLTHVHVRAVTGRAQLERCAEEDGDQGYVDWLADSARGTPLVAEFDSGAVKGALRGHIQNSVVHLHEAATAEVAVSDAVVRQWMQRARSVFSNIGSVHTDTIRFEISNAAMQLPSEAPLVISIDPYQLHAQPSAAIANLPGAVETVRGAFLSARRDARSASSAGDQAAHLQGDEGVEAWVGPMCVSLAPNGDFDLSRVDLRFGSGHGSGGALDVAIWGTGNTQTGRTDMHMGIKPQTLRAWSGYSSEESRAFIADNEVLVVDAAFDEAGKLVLENSRVGDFMLYTIRAHARAVLEQVPKGPSGGAGLGQWLRTQAEGLVADQGPLKGMERVGGGIVPPPIVDTLPWDA